jgi:hypothetical protein
LPAINHTTLTSLRAQAQPARSVKVQERDEGVLRVRSTLTHHPNLANLQRSPSPLASLALSFAHSGVEHGDQSMWACLKAHSDRADFGEECKGEVAKVKIKKKVRFFPHSKRRFHLTRTLQWALGKLNMEDLAKLSARSSASGIVLSGPMAVIAMFALALVLVVGAWFVWKRRAQSAGSYRVVLPGELGGGKNNYKDML